jgi:phosphoesterase RecJ-like protein
MKNLNEQIVTAIEKAQRIVIVFNRDWQGDAVASALALKLWLEKIGKIADIAAEKPSSVSSYAFLPSFASIKAQLNNLRKFIISLDITNTEVKEIEYKVEGSKLDFIISPKNGFFKHEDISSRQSGFTYDLIITLNAPDFESLGSIYDHDTEILFETTVINIDHEAANDNYGQINHVNINAVATAEILYELFQSKKDSINADIATCLLAGLIAETKSFKTANVSPRTLTIASDLIGLEGRREEIINALYRSRQLNVLKLWGSVLMGLKSDYDNRLVWSMIRGEDFVATETKPEDLSDVIDELIVSLPSAQVIVLAYETNNKVEVLVQSVKNLDALYVSQPWPVVGTRTTARVSLSKPLVEGTREFVNSVEEKMRRLQS